MKKSFAISAIVATILFSVTLQAKSSNMAMAQQLKQHAGKAYISKEIQSQKNAFKKAPKEIVNGLNDTLKALQALQKNDIKTAKTSLTNATKAFDSALKTDPKLKLVPLAQEVRVNAIESSNKEISGAIKLAQTALKEHHLQEAREILIPLTDEIDTATQYIPMDLYPFATKKALERLNKGDKEGALIALTQGLDMMVSDEVVIPIPLLSAEDLVVAASQLDKTKKKEAVKLLEDAKAELKKAILLGYSNRDSAQYKALSKQIETIQKEIKGKNEVEKLYSELKNSFKSLIHKNRTQSYKNSVPKKEAQALKNPSGVKGESAAKAKVEETHSKDIFEAKEKVQAFKKEAVQDEKK